LLLARLADQPVKESMTRSQASMGAKKASAAASCLEKPSSRKKRKTMEYIMETTDIFDALGPRILAFVGPAEAAKTRRVSQGWSKVFDKYAVQAVAHENKGLAFPLVFAATTSPAARFKTMFFHERALLLGGEANIGKRNFVTRTYGELILDERPTAEVITDTVVFHSNKGIVKFNISDTIDRYAVLPLMPSVEGVIVAQGVILMEDPRFRMSMFRIRLTIYQDIRNGRRIPMAVCRNNPTTTEYVNVTPHELGLPPGKVFCISTVTGEHALDPFLWQAQQLTPFGDQLRFL
jgi:hypothetical protein